MDAKLRTLCSQVLDIDSSDLTDDTNFFEAGGDSVTTLRLVAAARELNVSLDIEDVFNCPLLGDSRQVSAAQRFSGAEGHCTTCIGS